MSSDTTPRVDLTGLLSSPSTWLTVLAGALTRGDEAQARSSRCGNWDGSCSILAEEAAAAIDATERPGPAVSRGHVGELIIAATPGST